MLINDAFVLCGGLLRTHSRETKIVSLQTCVDHHDGGINEALGTQDWLYQGSYLYSQVVRGRSTIRSSLS
jgi:hypothetical protein